FDEDAAPKASAENHDRAPQPELTDNERITVRAPPKNNASAPTNRHRFYALASLLGAGLVFAVMLRHRAAPDARIGAAASRPPPRVIAAAPAVNEPAVESSAHVDSERTEALPSHAEPSTDEVVRTAATRSRRSRRTPASARERHGETKAAPGR